MALLLGEIEWGPPLVSAVVLPEWEDEAKRRFGGSSDFLRRVAPIPWLRRSCAAATLYPISVLPVRLADLMFLVVSQENSCRYCYGAARAHMRILGYSDRVISQIERETQLAELDAKDQAFIRFCRFFGLVPAAWMMVGFSISCATTLSSLWAECTLTITCVRLTPLGARLTLRIANSRGSDL